GATLGVAVIGSISASTYGNPLAGALPARLPEAAATAAKQSVGAAFVAADRLEGAGRAGLAQTLRDAAASAFFDGFEVACLVAAGVAVAGALLAALLIPAQPPQVPQAGGAGTASRRRPRAAWLAAWRGPRPQRAAASRATAAGTSSTFPAASSRPARGPSGRSSRR